MFAIAFDLTVADAERHHPKGVSQAYTDIRNALAEHGFDWVQGSLYVSKDEDLARLFRALDGLRSLAWFAAVVRDIRAFRVEQWSDFTATLKERR